MVLQIRRTGLDEYSPSGEGKLKVLLIGGPGVGKTRFSSYWPKPFYLDCEGGLSSVADRQVPYAKIKNSKDMLDALVHLKTDGMRGLLQREYKTVVIDTLDAFQRKVKDEWLMLNPSAKAFSGYEAWAYLDSKVQMLLTRLLNLDMNVIVCVHYTEKTVTKGEGAATTEHTQFSLQLSGAVKDQVFNDFDLVGWMGKYFATVDGQRVEKRGLTFTPTEEKSFLKDRLHATPKWLEITFSDEDYTALFMSVVKRLDELPPSEDVGEIADSDEGDREPNGLDLTAGVTAPGESGALPAQEPREIPLTQYDKPTLAKLARDEGVTKTVDGSPIRANTIKAELIEAIEAKRLVKSEPSTSVETLAVGSNGLTPTESVDMTTGEITSVSEVDAIESVLSGMGGEVVDSKPVTPVIAVPPQEIAADGKLCQKCGKVLAKEANQNHVKLSWIQFREHLCSEHFLVARSEKVNAEKVNA